MQISDDVVDKLIIFILCAASYKVITTMVIRPLDDRT